MANPPPTDITRASFGPWLKGAVGHGYALSEFYDLTFDWYEAQLHASLPSGVNADPEKLFIVTSDARAQTIKLENEGDIAEGIAMGFDAYGIVKVPINLMLDTTLYICGKPIGQAEGTTTPHDTVFGSVHCKIIEKWGAGNYLASMAQTNGGIVSDLNDDYYVLVRGDAATGYSVFTSFIGPTPGKHTATDNHFSIMMFKSLPNGDTEFRQSLRRSGQYYGIPNLEFGRNNIAFNASRDRNALKGFIAAAIELRDTGHIRP